MNRTERARRWRYQSELLSTECYCGAEKKFKETFCRPCYFRLPEDMRTDLYKRMGRGYEEAVNAAKELLGRPTEQAIETERTKSVERVIK